MATKELKPFGVSVKETGYTDAAEARGFTYTTRDNQFPSTNLACEDNPYKQDVLNAKNILDIGCGVGRNLPWIMDNTQALYWGFDPNEKMTKYFWDINKEYYDKCKDRVNILNNFSEMMWIRNCNGLSFDVVVSTFVFQHIGFRPPESQMNIADITKEIMKYTHTGTIWFLYEHQQEEMWIQHWGMEVGFYPFDVWKENYGGLPELTHRGRYHHLIIHKEIKTNG